MDATTNPTGSSRIYTKTSIRPIAFLAEPPTYEQFRTDYLLPLRPIIFDDPNLPSAWPCHTPWTKPDEKSGQLIPNVEAIVATFRGSSKPATVAFSGSQDGYGAEKREEMSFDNFLRVWNEAQEGEGVEGQESPYLKDFHLCLARPDYEAYRLYDLFQDDWMNAHALARTSDDYRFLYLGTAGTQTAWHHDVYLSHSWSTSITGVKRWLLLAPSDAHLLFHRMTREPPPIADLWAAELKSEDYPSIEEARKRCLVVWQYPNETMFVPSGWYHSVENFGSTLSINHNWANASCIANMYDGLADQVSTSVSLLSDLSSITPLPEFYTLVYVQMCKPSWGWSFAEFWDVVGYAIEHVYHKKDGQPEADEEEDGGPGKWKIRQGCWIDEGPAKDVVAGLARRWLAREEATCMPELADAVKRILRLCDG